MKKYTPQQITEAIECWKNVLDQMETAEMLEEEYIKHTTMSDKVASKAKLIRAKFPGRDVAGRPFYVGDMIVYFPSGQFNGTDDTGHKQYKNVYVKPEDMHYYKYMDAAREMLMKQYGMTADEFKNIGRPKTIWRR